MLPNNLEVFGSKTTKGPKQDRRNRSRSFMLPEEGEPYFLINISFLVMNKAKILFTRSINDEY